MWGIPNFLNVITNAPFLLIGGYGLIRTFKTFEKFPNLTARLIALVLFVGIFIVAFGSGYYHWMPENNTLVWDRAPMTLMFMPLFALLVYDFLGQRLGKIVFYVMVPLGLLSVWYWIYTESQDAGDLRFYAFVQFFPILIAPFILFLYPKKVTYIKNIILLLVFYLLAKLCEHYDDEIFSYFPIMSGHSIKHLFGAYALYHASEIVWGWQGSMNSVSKSSSS